MKEKLIEEIRSEIKKCDEIITSNSSGYINDIKVRLTSAAEISKSNYYIALSNLYSNETTNN